MFQSQSKIIKMNRRYMRSLWILFLFSLLVLLPSSVEADCGIDEYTLQEEFDRARVVVRLLYNCPRDVVNITCNVEFYDGDEYAITDEGYQSYTVAEVFKQDWTGLLDVEDSVTHKVILQPGSHIAVLYDTDTGFRKDLPFNLIADARGTLAFLTPYRQCIEEPNEENLDSGLRYY